MAEFKPWADRLKEEIDAFFRLWRERRWYAVILLVCLLGVGVYFVAGWVHRGSKIENLTSENKELKRDIRQIESENKSLRETVAPLIARAAREFPGEEINTSLKKIIERLEKDNPLQKPISSATATIELTIKSDEQVDTHYMDSGGYIAFGKGSTALLKTGSHESWARQTGKGEVVYRSVFTMQADDVAVGRPIDFLKDADFLQVEFFQMPAASQVLSGKIIFVVNDSTRLEFLIPQQQSQAKKVFVRDLTGGLMPLTQQ
jgi:hypothetical protein